MNKYIITPFIIILLTNILLFAGHPIITEDAKLIGRNRFQIELTPEFFNNVNLFSISTPIRFTYGLSSMLDVEIETSYDYFSQSDELSTSMGFTDLSIGSKWSITESNGFGFVLNPGISIPIGDYKTGFGSGSVGFNLSLLVSKEINEDVTFHFNTGYEQNENKIDERTQIWYTSLASEILFYNNLIGVLEIGTEINRDKSGGGNTTFITGGIIYSITEGVDLDFGLKKGINSLDTDYAILTGVTIRL
jgi:hypothetical protein